MVNPMNSGRIIERRDHVLIGFFVFNGDGFVDFDHQMMINKGSLFE